MDFELMPFDTQRCKARLSDFLFDGSALVPHEPDGSDFVSGKTSIVESSCNDRGKTMHTYNTHTHATGPKYGFGTYSHQCEGSLIL